MGNFIIDRLGARGDGIAGGADGPDDQVYIRGALPGETWRRDGEQFVLAGASSPDRVTPVCQHAGECGGCTFQHLRQSAYRAWIVETIAGNLARHDLGAEIGEPWHAAPGNRRRATFTLRRLHDRTIAGYNAHRSHVIFDLAECPVLDPALIAALPVLRALGQILLADRGEARASVTRTATGLVVDIAAKRGLQRPSPGLLGDVAACVDGTAICELRINGEIALTLAAPVVLVGDHTVPLTPGVFLQAAHSAERRMQSLVMEQIGEPSGPVADLFAGLGTFALLLAGRNRVAAFDRDAEAIAALKAAVRIASGLKPIDAVRRDLFREPLTPRELTDFAAAVINPPRTGANAQCTELAASGLPRIVMVSCNPATFARDARILVDGGYTLGTIHPVDQFLWSNHIEVVAGFGRAR